MNSESRSVVSRMKRNWRKEEAIGDFTGGPVLKTLPLHCRGPVFNLVRELRPHLLRSAAK